MTAIISRMIWSDELSASLDHVPSPEDKTQKLPILIFSRVELSRLQQLAQTLADKVNTMVDNNEKALDNKLGGSAGAGWAEGEKKAGGEADGRKAERATRGGRGGRGGLSQRGGTRFAQGLGNARSR